METISVIGNVTNIPAAVKQCIDLAGGFTFKPGDLVVIKPNICNAKNPMNMVLTDFRVIEAVTQLVKQHGNQVILVETDNISGTAEERVQESGFLDLCQSMGVEFRNLTHDTYQTHHIGNTKIRLPTTILDADYIINLPKMKTCAHTQVTLSIKNLYGLIQRKDKDKLHKHLQLILPYLAQTIPSDLIIVDALTCMEGNGPIIGNPLQLNLLIGGTNCTAVDSLCAKIMGYDPEHIPHIHNSQREEPPELNIVGDPWEPMCTPFTPPYTLKATLKSWKAVRDIYLN